MGTLSATGGYRSDAIGVPGRESVGPGRIGDLANAVVAVGGCMRWCALGRLRAGLNRSGLHSAVVGLSARVGSEQSWLHRSGALAPVSCAGGRRRPGGLCRAGLRCVLAGGSAGRTSPLVSSGRLVAVCNGFLDTVACMGPRLGEAVDFCEVAGRAGLMMQRHGCRRRDAAADRDCHARV